MAGEVAGSHLTRGPCSGLGDWPVVGAATASRACAGSATARTIAGLHPVDDRVKHLVVEACWSILVDGVVALEQWPGRHDVSVFAEGNRERYSSA